MSAFKERLLLWKIKPECGQTVALPSMNKYLEKWNKITISVFDVIKPILVEHLKNLITAIDCYIPNRNLVSQLWSRNPFLKKVDNLLEDVPGLQEQLIDRYHDKFHRQLFSTTSLREFGTTMYLNLFKCLLALLRFTIEQQGKYVGNKSAFSLCETFFKFLLKIVKECLCLKHFLSLEETLFNTCRGGTSTDQ